MSSITEALAKAGLVLVPRDPTTEMIDAGASVLCRMEPAFGSEEFWAKEVLQAMIAAALKEPAHANN